MRKAIFTVIFIMLISNLAYTQITTISGYVRSEKDINDISLFSIEDGRNKLLTTVPVGSDGRYELLFEVPYEGFYMLGQMDLAFPTTPLYLKPGDNAGIDFVVVDLLAEEGLCEINFAKKNTPENIVLGKWLKQSEKVRVISFFFQGGQSYKITHEGFFPELKQLLEQRDKFKKTIKTKNKQFNKTMSEFVDFNTEHIALSFLNTPRTKYPTEDEKPAFYKDMIVKGRFVDNNVLHMPWGADYLRMYVENAIKDEITPESVEIYLKTTELCGAYFLLELTTLGSYDPYPRIMESYGKYFVTPAMKKIVEETRTRLSYGEPGREAPNFTYPDIDGNKVSLTDFRGKLVLIDVWATWCGPCKEQIPALKELEKEMHGKDIVFVSVSVDEDKNFEKWKRMVVDKELGGVQLFGSGWSQITKDYKITGIPRFMLFDRDGKIISVNTPRPSNPALKEMIERHL